VDAVPSTNPSPFRRASVALGLVGYLSPIALIAIDRLVFVSSARELSGVFLYYDMTFGIACVALAALLLRLTWRKRLVAAVFAVVCFMLEIFILAMLAIALTGMVGIQ